jgi:hypothetical protein
MKLSSILIAFLMIAMHHAKSQTGVVIGMVKDKYTQEAIIGAVVSVEGTNVGSMSDLEGKYKLDAPLGSQNIKVIFLGYNPETKFNIVVTAGNAQTANFELEPNANRLAEVVVSFDKNKSAVAADMVTPLSVQKLTSEEIKSNPGGNFDVSRVIQVLPGVGGGTSANRNDIIVRGGAPNENVYYLDGIEIPVLNHFQTQGASGGATGILNVSFIEDVQLSSSAFDARFDNALASTFNLKQRTGNPYKFSGNVRLSGTEFATTLEGPLNKKTSYLFSARRSYLQLLFQLLDLPIRPDYWDFQYKVTHSLNETTTLTVIGVGAIDKFRLVAPKNATAENDYISRSNPMIDQWNYTVGFSLKKLIHKGFFTVALSRNLFDNSADKFENNKEEENYRTLKLRSQEIENKLRIEVNQYVNGWKFSYGFMAQYVKYNTHLYNRLSNGLNTINGAILFPKLEFNFNSEIEFFKSGAFAQLSKRFYNDKLLVSSGIRTDVNTFTQTGLNPLKTISPRLSFSYALQPTFDLTASIGSYYKIPIYTQLGYRDSNRELVNKNMKYIQCNHYVAGIQFLPKKDLKYTAEVFYKDYFNYPVSILNGISTANQGAEFTTVGNEAVISSGRGRTYGVEFFTQQKLIKKLFYALSATLYKSEFSGIDGKLLPSSWDYGYILSSTLGRKFKKGWEVGLKLRLAGGQPYTPFDSAASRLNYLVTGVGTLDYKNSNTQRLISFHQVDFRVDKKINFKKITWNVYFDMQNAFAFATPRTPSYTFKRNANNSGFETTDGNPIRSDGSNAIPVLLDGNNKTVVPTIGFIVEF